MTIAHVLLPSRPKTLVVNVSDMTITAESIELPATNGPFFSSPHVRPTQVLTSDSLDFRRHRVPVSLHLRFPLRQTHFPLPTSGHHTVVLYVILYLSICAMQSSSAPSSLRAKHVVVMCRPFKGQLEY